MISRPFGGTRNRATPVASPGLQTESESQEEGRHMGLDTNPLFKGATKLETWLPESRIVEGLEYVGGIITQPHGSYQHVRYDGQLLALRRSPEADALPDEDILAAIDDAVGWMRD